MTAQIKRPSLAILLSLACAVFALSPSRAGDAFSVESLTKYDHEASSYTVPASVNLVVLKKGSSDFVVWTRDELTSADLTVIESYARHQDPSLDGRNAIFISGLGSQTVDTMYGTITFEDGTYGLTVTMPRTWSHLDYGRYTDGNPPPAPDPNPVPGKIKLTKTVNGHLWRVRCDYMDVEDQDTFCVLHINGTLWKRDWIKNPGGNTSKEGHRLNKCGDAEHWVIWTDTDGVPYRMDEIKSGATGSTLPTVVYETKVEMTDEEIANIGNPDHPEYVTNYMKNFQVPMDYSKIQIGKRLYWITFNGGQVWYHSGIPYAADPQFVISIDGTPHVLTGGSSVEIEDLEPGIHDISESEDPLYSLGEVVSDAGGVIQGDNGWTVQLYVEPGADMNVTWPNIQPDPVDPPTPPKPPHIDPEPDPEPDPDTPVVPTMCELLDFGKRFNAVVFGNLTISGGDSEGNLLVWGNASLPYGYSVGIPTPGVGEPIPAAGPRDDALIVGGNLLIGKQDVNGNIVYGGDYLGEDRTWNSYSVRHVAPVTLDRTGNVPADGSGRTAADLFAAVKEVSQHVADMEVTGSITNDVNGSLILSGTNETRNVFSVTAEEWSGSQRDWIFDVPAGSKIIVNVTGASVDIANGRMVLASGLSLTPADVLVNYVDATLLTFSGFSHDGSVLAPFASGSFSGGAIQGIAIFGGDVVTKNGFEFHNFGLDVFFCPDRPTIVVTATAGSAADGDVLSAELNAEVDVTVVVSNPSAFWLRSVTLTNSTGATVLLGDIAPGGSVTNVQTITSAVEAIVTYTVWVSAKAYETSSATAVFMDRPFVTAYDIAVVAFAEGASAGGAAGAGNAGNPAAYNPTERVDYEVTDMWFSCVPTFAGENFTVNVRVKNNGQVDGNGAFLGLYLVDVDHGATIESNEVDTAVRSVEMGGIPAGGSRVYSFSKLTAPDASGTCRVIAFADMNSAELEWSKGDNQNNLTYELSQVAIHIDVSAEGVTLTWSNGWGQKYSILGSNDMEFWYPIPGHENIPSARDTDGLVENTETIGFDETEYHFFKLRINQR